MKQIQSLVNEYHWELAIWKQDAGNLCTLLAPDASQIEDLKRILFDGGKNSYIFEYMNQTGCWLPISKCSSIEMAICEIERNISKQNCEWRQMVWEVFDKTIDKFGDY